MTLAVENRVLVTSIAAQSDNLGDAVLRQSAILMCSESESKVVAWAGSMPESYLSVFRSIPGITLVSSVGQFASQVFVGLLKRRVDLLIGPGPWPLEGGSGTLTKRVAIALAALATRVSGGSVFSLGRAFKGSSAAFRVLERMIQRLSSCFTVRDSTSTGLLHFDARVGPDVAFSRQLLGPSNDKARKSSIAISFRFDDHPNDSAVLGLVELVREMGCEPVFVSQVRRDNMNHERWSELSGAEHVGWPVEVSHARQMERLDEVYSKCGAVVSNRLHVLIFGLTQGALAIDGITSHSTKVSSTISRLGVLSGSLPVRGIVRGGSDRWKEVLCLVNDEQHVSTVWQSVVASRDALLSTLMSTERRVGQT